MGKLFVRVFFRKHAHQVWGALFTGAVRGNQFPDFGGVVFPPAAPMVTRGEGLLSFHLIGAPKLAYGTCRATVVSGNLRTAPPQLSLSNNFDPVVKGNWMSHVVFFFCWYVNELKEQLYFV